MDKSDFSFNYYKSNQRCWSCTRSVCGRLWKCSGENPGDKVPVTELLRGVPVQEGVLDELFAPNIEHLSTSKCDQLKEIVFERSFWGVLNPIWLLLYKKGISSERSREETAMGQWQVKAWSRLLHSPQKEPTQPTSWSGFRVPELQYKFCLPSQPVRALYAISHV